MPRDSSGNMSLAKPPFVARTVASADDVNSNFGDIRDELSDSLSRSGKGGMLVPFQNMDGTLANPGITFSNEPGTGIRRAAANDVRGVVAGVDVLGLLRSGTSYIAQLFRGALRFIDPTGGKAVTVSPPSGLAADYALTLPTALPANAQPLVVSPAGAMSAGPITNAQQNFGTPSAASDVATKGYVDGRFPITQNSANIQMTGASPASTVGFSNTLTPANLPKAWGVLSVGAGNIVSVICGFNIAAVTIPSPTVLRVTLATPLLPAGNFLVLCGMGTFDLCRGIAYGDSSAAWIDFNYYFPDLIQKQWSQGCRLQFLAFGYQ